MSAIDVGASELVENGGLALGQGEEKEGKMNAALNLAQGGAPASGEDVADDDDDDAISGDVGENKKEEKEIVVAEDAAAATITTVAAVIVSNGSLSQYRRKIQDLHDDLIMAIFSFLLADDSILDPTMLVSKTWYEIGNKRELWQMTPSRSLDLTARNSDPTTRNLDPATQQNLDLVKRCFKFFGKKVSGTEGMCFKVFHRASEKLYAVKKARVAPQTEGVPYYMLRELSFLQGITHPNVSALQKVSLAGSSLYLFFDYVPSTLFDLINPGNNPSGGNCLPIDIVKRILHQILEGVAYCHRRGVLHRNLKPKHVLLDGLSENGPFPVTREVVSSSQFENYLIRARNCTARISDFALVRAGTVPLRNYTTEVVTLWYRAPEILMGGRYFSAVDIWSVGCIFAEMVVGRPIFPGICEIDQLFQIFVSLGTPTEQTWKGFCSLPNFAFKFPKWQKRPMRTMMPGLEPNGVDLLERLLSMDPEKRITAEAALRHDFFSSLEENAKYRSKSPLKAELDSLRPEYATQHSIFFSSKDSLPLFGPSHSSPPNVIVRSSSQPHSVSSISNTPYISPRKTSPVFNFSSGVKNKYKKTQEEFWSHFGDWLPNPHVIPEVRSRQGLSDVAFVSRYYSNLKVLEKRTTPFMDFITIQAESTSNPSWAEANRSDSTSPKPEDPPSSPANEETRLLIINWLVELIDRFEMNLRSVFLALNYMDRYIQYHHGDIGSLDKIAAAALHVASKLEDVSYIGVEDLVNFSNRRFTNTELLELEEKLLTTLQFELTVPTALDFLGVFLDRFTFSDSEENIVSAARAKQQSALNLEENSSFDDMFHFVEGLDMPTPCLNDDARSNLIPNKARLCSLGTFLCELSLQETFFITKPCSQVSAAALVIAMACLEIRLSNERIQAVTGYSVLDLGDCLRKLRDLHLRAHADNETLFHRRYRKEATHQVAFINPLSVNIDDLFGLRKQQEERTTFVYPSAKRIKLNDPYLPRQQTM